MNPVAEIVAVIAAGALKINKAKKHAVDLEQYVSPKDVMQALGMARSTAYRFVRRACGRTEGRVSNLRCTVDQFHRQCRKEGLGR